LPGEASEMLNVLSMKKIMDKRWFIEGSVIPKPVNSDPTLNELIVANYNATR